MKNLNVFWVVFLCGALSVGAAHAQYNSESANNSSYNAPETNSQSSGSNYTSRSGSGKSSKSPLFLDNPPDRSQSYGYREAKPISPYGTSQSLAYQKSRDQLLKERASYDAAYQERIENGRQNYLARQQERFDTMSQSIGGTQNNAAADGAAYGAGNVNNVYNTYTSKKKKRVVTYQDKDPLKKPNRVFNSVR